MAPLGFKPKGKDSSVNQITGPNNSVAANTSNITMMETRQSLHHNNHRSFEALSPKPNTQDLSSASPAPHQATVAVSTNFSLQMSSQSQISPHFSGNALLVHLD